MLSVTSDLISKAFFGLKAMALLITGDKQTDYSDSLKSKPAGTIWAPEVSVVMSE